MARSCRQSLDCQGWIEIHKGDLEFWYHPTPERLYVTAESCNTLGISTLEMLVFNDGEDMIHFGDYNVGMVFDKLLEIRPKAIMARMDNRSIPKCPESALTRKNQLWALVPPNRPPMIFGGSPA